MKLGICWLLIFCTVPWLAGCADMADYSLTGRLWKSDPGPFEHGPTPSPNVKFYQTADGKDTLVQYDESYDKDGVIQRRAYLLHENERRIDAGRKPHFVDVRLAEHLEPIPTNGFAESDPNATNAHAVWAVLKTTDGREFSLCADGREFGPYHLPVYHNHAPEVDRALLTPLTVTGDVVIYSTVAAAVAGVLFIWFEAQDNSTLTVH